MDNRVIDVTMTRLILIVALVIAGSLAAFLLASNIPRTYESRAVLLVGQPFTSNYDALLADQLKAQTYADVATTSTVLEKVIDQVGLEEDTASLAPRVLAAASRGSSLVRIRVTDTNAGRAAEIANSVAAQLIEMTAESSGASKDISLIDPAVVSTAPSWPHVQPMTAAGGAIGLLLALVIIVGIDYVRTGDGRSAPP